MKESDLQKQILDYLRFRGIFCWKASSTGIYDPKRNVFRTNQAKGVSDILGILHAGRLLAIEVKLPKGKVSFHQQQFLDEIRQRGGLAVLARSLDDVVASLGTHQ